MEVPTKECGPMYVVAGVSGNTGKVVADTLLRQKQPVRVLVRDVEKGAPWKARGADVRVVGLDDVAGLTAALEGAKGAYLLLPPQMSSTDARNDNARRTDGYVNAIRASATPHIVFLSSIAAQKPTGTGPILSVHDAEVALPKSGATFTFVRAAYFQENLAGSLYDLANGVFPTFLTPDRAIAMVASHDIGTTAAKALLEGPQQSVIELSGPRDYSPNDIATVLGRITGKEIKVAVGPEDAIIPALTGAGLNTHWAGLYKEMIVGLNRGHVAFEGGSARAVRGTTEVETVLGSLVAK
jgi:uncharacterized protein YbjT (DUF2867 family)